MKRLNRILVLTLFLVTASALAHAVPVHTKAVRIKQASLMIRLDGILDEEA